MQTKAKIAVGLGAALFIGYMIYSTMGMAQVSCEVCIEFRGRTSCSSATGADAEEAQKTATDVACASIASGMTDSIACGNRPPTRIMCKER